MMFNRLVQMIETQSDEIVTSLVHRIRQDPELKRLPMLTDPELRQWASGVVTRLGNCLGTHDDGMVVYEKLGRLRCQQHIPLHETLREILLLKETIVRFLRERAFANTQVELYAEEELEHQIHGYFDHIIYHFVRGYEGASGNELRSMSHSAP